MNVFLIVIDSFGIGALPDAAEYGDEGANTAVHISRAVGGVRWPILQNWGLGNVAKLGGSEIMGCPAVKNPKAQFGMMAEKSPGKDTTTGHWELAGIVLDNPFPVFHSNFPSFPQKLIDDFVSQSNIPGILGNKAASGTIIMEELGQEHMANRKPICYTSADSVFQIAAHKSIYSLDKLYSLCEKARLLCNSYHVGRVIARPFTGKPGNFKRTAGRKDWSIALPTKSLLDYLLFRGIETVAVGKIGSIFNEQGIAVSYHEYGNEACMSKSLEIARQRNSEKRFVFVNLVDTDMIFGHRRDPQGYSDAVQRIDDFLGELGSILSKDDVIAVSGDHGCDPTFRGSDHTREYVPVLWHRVGFNYTNAQEMSLGVRESFSDVSASVQRHFGLQNMGPGTPFV